MALNKQVWLNTIVENFFPDNSFATKSIDDSVFVSNKTVHIPNAGAPSGVVINRTEKPANGFCYCNLGMQRQEASHVDKLSV